MWLLGMETHFIKLPTKSSCVDVASRGSSVVSVATEDRRFVRVYTLQPFETLASYDGATSKVTELFSKAILLPMFVCGDYMAVYSIL